MNSPMSLEGGTLLPLSNVDLKARRPGDDSGLVGRFVRVEFSGEPLEEVQANPIVGFVMNHEYEASGTAEAEDHFIIKQVSESEIIEMEVDPNFLISHAWMRKNVGFGYDSPAIIRLVKVSDDAWGVAGVWRLGQPDMCQWCTIWPTDANIRVSVISTLADERREFLDRVLAKLKVDPGTSPEELLEA